MSLWKCKYFAKRIAEDFYWTEPVENCGLCVNYKDGKCIHEEQLKESGEPDYISKKDCSDFCFNRINNEYDERGGYGKSD